MVERSRLKERLNEQMVTAKIISHGVLAEKCNGCNWHEYSTLAHQGKNANFDNFLHFPVHGKMAWDGPK